MDYLLDVVEQKSCFGRGWNWVTKKFDTFILEPCKTAMLNAWNFLKTKTIEACTCYSSDNDESDRYVVNSFLSKNDEFQIQESANWHPFLFKKKLLNLFFPKNNETN